MPCLLLCGCLKALPDCVTWVMNVCVLLSLGCEMMELITIQTEVSRPSLDCRPVTAEACYLSPGEVRLENSQTVNQTDDV